MTHFGKQEHCTVRGGTQRRSGIKNLIPLNDNYSHIVHAEFNTGFTSTSQTAILLHNKQEKHFHQVWTLLRDKIIFGFLFKSNNIKGHH